MNITFQLHVIPDPRLIPLASRPARAALLPDPAATIPHTEIFVSLLDDLITRGEPLLNEIFTPIFGNRTFHIPVVLTHGLSAPYDAWTAPFHGDAAFFFNLSQWSEEGLKTSGLAVVKHEATHVLLSEVIPTPPTLPWRDLVEYLLLNEGLAHFVGCPFSRETLCVEKRERWENAERVLAEALEELEAPLLTKERAQDLLTRGNAGPFWDKYISMAGMFRVAALFERRGSAGLREVIFAGRLPAQP